MTHYRRLSPLFSRTSFALVLILLTVASAATTTRSSSVPVVSIENFGKVDDHYYRGSQPHHKQFAELKGLGIKTVIDLRRDFKPEAEKWAEEIGLKYFRIPLNPATPATREQTSYFLSLVSDPANWPVYVHCKGGKHRTGAMTAIYRITHDEWTADQAYLEMKQYHFNDGFLGGPGAQKKFVYSFYEHFRATVTTGQK
jgi:tyrosine-protein phosphatase SIW14